MKNVIFFTKSLPLFNNTEKLCQKVDKDARLIHSEKLGDLTPALKSLNANMMIIDGGSFPEALSSVPLRSSDIKYIALMDLSVTRKGEEYISLGYDFIFKKPINEDEFRAAFTSINNIELDSRTKREDSPKKSVNTISQQSIIKEPTYKVDPKEGANYEAPKKEVAKIVDFKEGQTPEAGLKDKASKSNEKEIKNDEFKDVFDDFEAPTFEPKGVLDVTPIDLADNQNKETLKNKPSKEDTIDILNDLLVDIKTPKKDDKGDVLSAIQKDFEKMSAGIQAMGLEGLPDMTNIVEENLTQKEKVIKMIRSRNKRSDSGMTKQMSDEMLNILVSENEKTSELEWEFSLSSDRRYLPVWKNDRTLTIYRVHRLKDRGLTNEGIASRLNDIYKKEREHFESLKDIHFKARKLDLSIDKNEIIKKDSSLKTKPVDTMPQNLQSRETALEVVDEINNKLEKPEKNEDEEKRHEREASVGIDINKSISNYDNLDSSIKLKDKIELKVPNVDSQLGSTEYVDDNDPEELLGNISDDVSISEARYNDLSQIIESKEEILLKASKEGSAINYHNEEDNEDIIAKSMLEVSDKDYERYDKLNKELYEKERINYIEIDVEEIKENNSDDVKSQVESNVIEQLDSSIDMANKTALKGDDKRDEPKELKDPEELEHKPRQSDSTYNNEDEDLSYIRAKTMESRRRTQKSNDRALTTYNNIEDIIGSISTDKESLLSKYRDAARQKQVEDRLSDKESKRLRDSIPIEPPRDVFVRTEEKEEAKKKKFGFFRKKK